MFCHCMWRDHGDGERGTGTERGAIPGLLAKDVVQQSDAI
jgi:hypothetical protein